MLPLPLHGLYRGVMIQKGFKTGEYRSTETTVYSPGEGTGRLIAGEQGEEKILEWKPRDIFAVPCWVPYRFEADSDATLFSYTDRTAQQKLGFWREMRGNA